MKKRFCLLIAAALLLSLLCGCGGSGKSEAMPSNYAKNDSAAINAADSSSGWAAEAQTAAEPKAPVQTGTSLPAMLKLIYRANIDMESTEFDTAVQGLTDLVTRLGGYFENSELDNYANYRRANYVVRLPAENFETFCGAVGELCQVNSLSRSAEDVSERYYDTESRLVTQQTKLARLQELLRQAEEMEDIITLESAISETELAIEQLTGTLRKYDSLVSYATVTLYLTEVYKLSEVEQPAIGFGAKLAQAFKTGGTRFVNGFQSFLLSLARGWIGWLIFIIIVAAVIIIVRKVIRRRKTKTASAPPPYPPQPPQGPQPPQNPPQL